MNNTSAFDPNHRDYDYCEIWSGFIENVAASRVPYSTAFAQQFPEISRIVANFIV